MAAQDPQWHRHRRRKISIGKERGGEERERGEKARTRENQS